MAIFDTARLRDVLVRGRIAEPEPATDLVNELEQQMDTALSRHPTHDRMDAAVERLLRSQAEMEARIADMMAQQARHINQAVRIVIGTLLAAIALAVGIILGFG